MARLVFNRDDWRLMEKLAGQYREFNRRSFEVREKADRLDQLSQVAPAQHTTPFNVVKLREEAQQLSNEATTALNAFNIKLGFHVGADWPTEDGPEGKQARSPHCDQYVLHAPGECEFCDLYPKRQAWRVEASVNFTGHDDADKMKCPSEMLRPRSVINRWSGNVAKPKCEEAE
jgi:hypothetical protein